MTPTIIAAASEQSRDTIRPGVRVRWRDDRHLGGPYLCVACEPSRVQVRVPVRRGSPVLWWVHAASVEVAK
jgi:hypothetical protein